MKALLTAASAASLMLLSACGGNGDDALGERAEDAAENKADNMDAMADNMSGAAADNMEAQAEAVREAGDAKEEAIDDSNVNAEAMTEAQKNAVVNK
jgi:gas vesicle protein